MRVFLGGTCNGSEWRTNLIAMLGEEVEYFNPVVADWGIEAQNNEILEKQNCDYHLYVLTPAMSGVFSVAEAVESSIRLKKNCLFCVLEEDAGKEFTSEMRRSIQAVTRLVADNGAVAFSSLKDVADHLNSKFVTDTVRTKEGEAPRVTQEHIISRVADVKYARLSHRLTVCVLTLVNGFEVTGESPCVSEENYNQETGERIAYENALDKVWLLEGYLLKESLHLASQYPEDAAETQTDLAMHVLLENGFTAAEFEDWVAKYTADTVS